MSLGCLKLKGYYSFEKTNVLLDMKDLVKNEKKNKIFIEQRIMLMQYTRYHALSRITLAFIGLSTLAMNGVEEDSTSKEGIFPIGLGFAFWHGAASLVVVVHLSSYPIHAKMSGGFFLHAILAIGFTLFCIYGPAGEIEV